MNRLALIYLVLSFPVCVVAQRPTPTPTPTSVPRTAVRHYRKHVASPTPTPTPETKGVIVKQGMVCRTKQQDLELRDWIGGLMRQVRDAESENDAAQKSNTDLQGQLAASVQAATALANECAKDKACAKAPLSCWFHRLIKHIFWIAGAIVVLLIALIVINIMTGGALSGFFAIFGAIGKWIARLFTPKPPAPPTV